VGWIYTELVLVSLAAMLSPTTLTFSVLALVLSPRPFRTGCWFLLGALTATLAVGIAAAFILGDTAASSEPSSPKTWVAILDVIFGVVLVVVAVRFFRKTPDPAQTKAAIDRMSGLATSPAVAIVGAGALLANPGGFIPIALKTISETDPSARMYALEWLFFSIAAVLPLIVAVILLAVRTEWTKGVLGGARTWLERNGLRVASVIIFLLALGLLRNGIAGLTS